MIYDKDLPDWSIMSSSNRLESVGMEHYER